MNGRVTDTFRNGCLECELKVSKEYQKSDGRNRGDGVHGDRRD